MVNRYACCVCHVIPSTTVLLPCSHVICELCMTGCIVLGSFLCPLDKETFFEGDCQKIQLPAKTKQNLKAHCWNEGDGCEFVGTIEAVLLHFDRDCSFHSTRCSRCEQRILRTDIASHYLAGCHGNASSASGAEWYDQQNSSTRPDLSATLDKLPALLRQMEEVLESCRTSESARSQDTDCAIGGFGNSFQRGMERLETSIGSTVAGQLNAGLEELKAVIRDSSNDNLSRAQSQVNELIEQSRRQDASQLREIVCVLRDSGCELKEQMNTIEANLSSMIADTQHSLERIMDSVQNSEPSAIGIASTVASSIEGNSTLRRKKKQVILSRLETFARVSMSTLENLRQQIDRHDEKPWISDVYEVQECCCCHVGANRCLFPVCMSINNVEKAFQSKERHLVYWYQWISWDAYMKVEVSICPDEQPGITVYVDCVKLMENSRLPFGVLSVEALQGNAVHNGVNLIAFPSECEDCSYAKISHLNPSFHITKEKLAEGDFIKDGKLRLVFRFR
uniref:Dynein light chain n=1 Tax=Rhipicephalus appendiculatus TaxID=34631 RepID=A0A131YTX7_RHIAP